MRENLSSFYLILYLLSECNFVLYQVHLNIGRVSLQLPQTLPSLYHIPYWGCSVSLLVSMETLLEVRAASRRET